MTTNFRNLTDHLPLDVALSYYKKKVSDPQSATVEFPPVVSGNNDAPFYDELSKYSKSI